MTLSGVVVSGVGGSTKWMPSYLPELFPGTLNIKLDSPIVNIVWEEQYYHKDFERYFYKRNCKINGISAYLILPPLCTSKSHLTKMKNPSLIEVGHEKKLRDLLLLKTGDRVVIEYETKGVYFDPSSHTPDLDR